MLKDTWQEAGRLESLFLEIVEDPSKKEVLLYPICYCQLVRRENTFEVELPKLIGCANKTFQVTRGMWQDILLELDLFQLITPGGDVLQGKDILRVQSPEGFRVSFLPEYREVFYEVYSRFLKYWTVLSKVSSYSRRNTPAEAVYLSVLIFNEELFREVVHFCSAQGARYPREAPFFSALGRTAEFYIRVVEKREFDLELLNGALEELNALRDIYYGVNLGRLRRDLEDLIREVSRNRRYFLIKIGFHMRSDRGRGLLRRFIDALMGKIREIGGRSRDLLDRARGTQAPDPGKVYLPAGLCRL
jgi:hypothetical protein